MSTQSKPRGSNTIRGEGAAVEFLGEGFPPGAALEMGELLARLATPPIERPTREKAQPIEQITDVVVQSALSIVEDEILDYEAEFAQQATEKPVVNNQNPEVEAAKLNLARVMREAQNAGFFLISTVEKVTDE